MRTGAPDLVALVMYVLIKGGLPLTGRHEPLGSDPALWGCFKSFATEYHTGPPRPLFMVLLFDTRLRATQQ